MRWIRILILIVLVCLIDTTILPHISVRGMRPDLALILVMFVSLHTSTLNSVPACWLIGLVKNVISVGPMGLNALILSVCGAYVSHTKDYIYKDHPIAQLFVALTTAFLANAMYLVFMFLSPQSSFGRLQLVAFRMVCAIIYTALPAPFFILILRALKPWLGFTDKPTLEPKGEH